jgi:dTDP-4-amino-4,6-dideoxygalactose transaminase
MRFINQRVQQRRDIFDYYYENFGRLPGISFQTEAEGSYSNRWLTCLICDPKESHGIHRNQILDALRQENIDARPLFKPMHSQPIFANLSFYGDGTADFLFEQGLCLPSGSNMTETDLQRVVDCVHSCFK